MNKIIFLALFATFATFAQTKAIQLHIEIKNPNSDSIVIHNKEFKTTLKGKNGKFSGNFEAPKGFYQLFDGAKFAQLYCSEGFDLKITADGKQFESTLAFSGNGAAENNYLLQKKVNDGKIRQSFGSQLPDENTLQNILNKRLSDAKSLLASGQYEKDFTPLMIAEYEKENQRIMADLIAVKAKENGLSVLKNTQAPEFDFENHKGGKTKLSDLKGKILYIDIWATWCGPCRTEIPHLKKLEEEFKNHNIEFVSISIDELKNHDKWAKFVSEKELKGIQLLADSDWKSAWIRHFKIEGIPRFILIGRNGEILDADAPRPSSPETAKILTELLAKK
ncbi:TlpA family protein disulfide reductase [Flavobacterium sp. PLA-1-15]|uniref:TlpA family protein disulfide reductase n=1 Tax=Flavobacterium sp. PLA-1-15 TaxID=3380533 RepID=UPI003B762BA1